MDKARWDDSLKIIINLNTPIDLNYQIHSISKNEFKGRYSILYVDKLNGRK